jgi:hypothetical protein
MPYVDGLSRLPPIRLKSGPPSPESPERTARQTMFPDKPNLNGRVDDEKLDSIEELDTQQLLEPTLPNKAPGLEIPSISLEASDVPVNTYQSIDASSALPKKSTPDHSRSPPSSLADIPPKTEKPAPTPISGDILLPILIFSVVKSNPPHLVSHLLYTQRFRNQSIGGEESYCLINLTAVAEFLENVDLGALGLGEGRVLRFGFLYTPYLSL